MANTAEQMKVFGYTPEGLDQEVEKYAGEAKEDFAKSKLEEERRANHPLNNVPFFQRPVNASTDDIEVSTSDPDVRAFKNKFGETYTIATSPDQRVEREKLRDGIISSLEGVKGYLENPFLPDKEQVVDFVKGAAVGTLEQIKQSMESGATYGDIFGTLAGVGAASTPFKVPKGSLRLFGGVSMEGAAKDKNLKKAIALLKDSDFYKFNRPASKEGGISYDLNKKIWSQTGWYVDPADGQWRYFIDDTKASLKNLDEISNLKISPDARNPTDLKTIKVSDIFDHPEFYKKYPEFKDLKITFYNADRKNPKNVNLLGSYDETRNSLKINMGAATHMSMVDGKFVTNPDALKKTLLHELQHVIQRKENFVRGASADDIPPDLVYDKDRELRGKKKPIQKKFDEVKSEFDRTDNRLKEARKAAGENPLPGLTIQQEIEIYNKHYSEPDKLRPDVTWASTAREYGVPVSVVQKAAGRTNLIGRLNRKLTQQGKVYNKLADEVYDVDRERSRIETNFYEGAGGEIEARLTEDMLDNPDMFPIDARAGMLEYEGDMYEYQGKYGVDPFNYEVKPRREPESTNLIDTVKKKFGIVDNVKPLTLQQQRSLSPDLKILFDQDNTQVFKNILIDDTFAREVLAEYRSPTRDISRDPASLKDVQAVRKELYDLTQQSLKDLPEEITVYRYGPLNESDGLSSFTLNPDFGTLSLPWAKERNYPLESYTVKKSEILAAPDLIRTFDEAEVIIRNNAVKKEPKNFAEGGDTVRPEPRPEAEVDVSPKAEAGDQFFVKQAEREKAFKTKPKPRPSMDKSFPDVKPKARPKRVEKSGVYTEEYDLKGVSVEIPVIVFKDGERIAFDKALQTIAERGTANEPVVGMSTEKQIRKFLDENNPTREEFETYWYNKRLNKGGMIGDQMQMAFMNEGGLTDDGMDVDPVSGNDIPSGSMAEEVRDDIPAQLSDGEYVVPADVVRYYGVKFFEDLRDQAKMGLAEMEANGRIGGEPVPAGGPINNEELSPEEMQAIQEMMGMSQGGAIGKLNQQQQILQEPSNKAVGNSQMMYGGGQVRGYQDSSLVTGSQVESSMLGGQSPAQVEQQMLSAGSAARAENYIGSPLGFSIFGDSSTGVQNPNQQGVQQTEAKAFAPITLYNTAGQTKTVNSAAEEKSARAAGFNMTLDQYNMYRSQRGGSGGSGGGSGIITPPGQEDKESKPWGEGVDWNNQDSIRKFVKEAQEGNIEGASGRFLRGAGFALLGLPGAMLVGAFQTFQGKQTLADMQTAQEIARANGFDDLATEIQGDINTYLKTAGDAINFVNDVFGPSTSQADRWARTQGFDTLEEYAAAQEDIKAKAKTKNVDALRTKMQKDRTSKTDLAKAKVTAIKSEAKRTGKSIAEIGREKAPSSEAKSPTQKAIDEGDPRAGNKGGLMTKNKKAKK